MLVVNMLICYMLISLARDWLKQVIFVIRMLYVGLVKGLDYFTQF